MTRVLVAVLAVLAVTMVHSSGAAQDAEPDNSWLEEVKCSEDWMSVPMEYGENPVSNDYFYDGVVTLRKKDIYGVNLSREGSPASWNLTIDVWSFGKIPREFRLPEHLYPQVFHCLGSE